MNPKQLKDLVIVPTLEYLEMLSDSAVNLLLMTAAHETWLGHYLKQFPTGPALGLWGMERDTHDSLQNNYIYYRDALKEKVNGLCSGYRLYKDRHLELIDNLKYACAMARIKYYPVKQALPSSTDILGLANYYKEYYNTKRGDATIEEVVRDYNKYVVLKL